MFRFAGDESEVVMNAWILLLSFENKMNEVMQKWKQVRKLLGIGKEPGRYCTIHTF